MKNGEIDQIKYWKINIFLPYIQNDIIHNQIYKKNIHFMLNKFRPIKF